MITKLIEPADGWTLVELERISRCVRVCRLHVDEQLMHLQEKHSVVGNGYTREAMLHCENDMFVLTSCIFKLERMIQLHKPAL